ncbi:MAG: hypothetical protein H6742_11860 [Alphaproteobacteria bacterium]|nr:hypothetical protein [Alphaproteobacteria bacterium]
MSDTPPPDASASGSSPSPTPDSPRPGGGVLPPDDRPTSSKSSIVLALGLMAALVAAAVAIVMVGSADPAAQPKGDAQPKAAARTASADVPAGPPVELQVILATGGEASALDPGQDVQVGDQVVFQVTVEEPARVRVWAEVDGLPHQQLGTFDVEGTAVLGDEEGLAGFGFGNPGAVVFRASTAESGCPVGACASWAVIAH